MLRRVNIDSLNLGKSYFHFTKRINLDRIETHNLIPAIGENSAMIEESKKIFFSIGASGILMLHDVWLKWMMNRMFGEYSLKKKYDSFEYESKMYNWVKEFLSKEYRFDEKKKNMLFTKYYHDMLDCVYLELNLSDGRDYDSNDYDEVKMRLNENTDSLEYLFMKEMYGEYSSPNSKKMEVWNMHTIRKRYVKPRFIRVVGILGKDANVIDVLKYLYSNYKDRDYDLLDSFMVWLNDNEGK